MKKVILCVFDKVGKGLLEMSGSVVIHEIDITLMIKVMIMPPFKISIGQYPTLTIRNLTFNL